MNRGHMGIIQTFDRLKDASDEREGRDGGRGSARSVEEN